MNPSTAVTTRPAPSPEQRRQNRRALLGAGVGNALEWYDWNVYASFTVFLASQLFNNADPTSAILSVLAIFAVGFVARPFGGLVFGWIADRRGRKFSMVLAVGLASLGSLLIAVAPTFETAGILASVILLSARLIQGLAHGGELPSAQTYLSEAAPRHKRGLWSSLIYISGTCGILFGQLLGAVLTSTLSEEAMNSYGWRIPFLVGAVLGLFAFYIRRRMAESEIYEQTASEGKTRERLWPQLVKYRRSALQVVGMTLGITVAYYVWAVSAASYAATHLGIDPQEALWSGVVGSLVFIVALPLWGALSDKIGRRPVLLVGTVGTGLLFLPMTSLMRDGTWFVLSLGIMLIFLAAFLSISPAVYSEIFPTSVRTIGVGVPYALCVALFGGTAPYLQTWMATTSGGQNLFPIYTVVLLAVSTLAVLTLPETRARDLGVEPSSRSREL
ncbi:MFS transporter [Pengzhenrongella sp.]|jgi:MHS family alpha-ketoglutarate permease-like MFS transporter|uniref:MFS transporter n=1 Tax=Pengzhenrongella sp. TaxID=2888820 RepID=UPI002F94D3A3